MLVNLTPHEVRIFNEEGKWLIAAIPPSGAVARVSVERKLWRYLDTAEASMWIPVMVGSYGPVVGLPDPVPGTVYIVSAMVRQAVPDRVDVLSPGELIRNEAGQPIGCRGLEASR